jgi:uncharacterized membrane protein YfcA
MFFEHIPHLHYIWLVAASTIAGVMNAMAGGGSFLSFPAMLGMGVLPVQANATNTVALWPGQLTSLATLRGDVRKDLLPTVAVTSVLGGVLGGEVLLHTAQRTFMHMIPWLMLVGTVIFAISGPVSKWIRRRAQHEDVEPYIPRFWLACALFPVCFYIGYFGAGSGFMVMTIFALFGMERMHTLNALKVVATLLANLCAIIAFIFQGAIVWHYCVVSMVFAALGGWVGARFARRVNGDVLRAIVVVTGCVIAAYFFWRQTQG